MFVPAVTRVRNPLERLRTSTEIATLPLDPQRAGLIAARVWRRCGVPGEELGAVAEDHLPGAKAKRNEFLS